MQDGCKSVQDILCDVPYEQCRGLGQDVMVSSLEFSSADVHEGSLFFCIPGLTADGHDFAHDALARGAAALVVQHELDEDVPQFLVEDARKTLALASARFYDDPSSHLRLVGITGTNGKTTTAFLVEHLVKHAGLKAGLMGTVECHVADEVLPSLHTTPESRDLQQMLARMVDAGVDTAALEVSSHALELDRIAGTHVAVAAFTNLTQDHLDYHKTMEAYFQAKAKLFTRCEPETSVICTDNTYGKQLVELCGELGRNVITVSAREVAQGAGRACGVQLVSAAFAPHSTQIVLCAQGEQRSFTLPLVGRFNVENALVAFGIGLALGFDSSQIVAALESAPQIPGRLERVIGANGTVPPFGVLVDYAHTPDSLEKAIAAVKAITPDRVICVFGCGGDRDHGKRPKMGRAALNADIAIVTSDNPRTEDPDAIIEQILPGMQDAQDSYAVYPDRREAITRALKMAQPGDTVLIAGKGHEDYQIIGHTKYPFDDRLIASEGIELL